MANEWKFKIRQVKRLQDFRSMLGWNWEWELRKWVNMSRDDDSGYYAPDLFDWHGRARSAEQATAAVTACHDRLVANRHDAHQWIEWYKDLENESA